MALVSMAMDSLKAPSAWCRPKNKTAANVMNKE
jgi:hypothetical protein